MKTSCFAGNIFFGTLVLNKKSIFVELRIYMKYVIFYRFSSLPRKNPFVAVQMETFRLQPDASKEVVVVVGVVVEMDARRQQQPCKCPCNHTTGLLKLEGAGLPS